MKRHILLRVDFIRGLNVANATQLRLCWSFCRKQNATWFMGVSE